MTRLQNFGTDRVDAIAARHVDRGTLHKTIECTVGGGCTGAARDRITVRYTADADQFVPTGQGVDYSFANGAGGAHDDYPHHQILPPDSKHKNPEFAPTNLQIE